MPNYCCNKTPVTTCAFQASPDPAPDTLLAAVPNLALASARRCSPFLPTGFTHHIPVHQPNLRTLRCCDRLVPYLAVDAHKDFTAWLTMQRSKIDMGLLNTTTDSFKKSRLLPTDFQSPIPDTGGKENG